MAHPFIVIGSVAVTVVTAGIGLVTVPGWVESAQDEAARGDLAQIAAVQTASLAEHGRIVTDLDDSEDVEFQQSSSTQLVGMTADGEAGTWCAVVGSASGRFFARSSDSPEAGVGVTPVGARNDADCGQEALDLYDLDGKMPFGWASHTLDTMASEEAAFGVDNAIVSTYSDFVRQPGFPAAYADAAVDRGAMLLVAWEPWDNEAPITTQDEYAPRTIIAGEHDAHIARWLGEAQEYADEITIMVRFAPEMNDAARPWSPGIGTVGHEETTPEEYIAMWRHVYELKEAIAPNVVFMWNPLNYGASGYEFEAFWPGDGYVDTAALDGFNWGDAHPDSPGWQASTDVFGFDDPAGPVGRLKALVGDKPWGIAEVASAPADPADFEPGGPFYDSYGSWVFDYPENPPYEQTADDWITQEGWTEMMLRRAADAGASYTALFHTDKETNWRLTDTTEGAAMPAELMADDDRVIAAPSSP